MNDVVSVRIAEASRHLGGNVDRLRELERLPGMDAIGKGLAVVIRHDDEGAPVRRFFNAVNRSDVDVIERGGYAGLLEESLLIDVAAIYFNREELERDNALQLEIARAIDHSHAAGAGHAHNLVISGDDLTDGKRTPEVRRYESIGGAFIVHRFGATCWRIRAFATMLRAHEEHWQDTFCWRYRHVAGSASALGVYITGGTLMPMIPSTLISSRRTTAAVASRNFLRPSSASVST